MKTYVVGAGRESDFLRKSHRIHGHERQTVWNFHLGDSKTAGIETMPVIVKNPERDEAIVIVVDSNLQHENILPSERSAAYKMKLEAIKRQAGRPKNNLRQVGTDMPFDRRYSACGETQALS